MQLPPPSAIYFKELDASGQVMRIWPLGPETTWFIGRADSNSISLPYAWISRRHAMLRQEEDGSLTLIDLGSSNGTFVNNRRISTPICLRHRDLVRVGKTMLTFIQDIPDPSATIPADLTADRTMIAWQKEQVTILICDMHHFTTLSEQLDAQTLSDILKHWSGRVSQLIKNEQGTIDKFIGDAVLAIWVDMPQPQSIRQAMRAALAINYFTRTINKDFFDLPWELSIGAAINSGEAVLGNTGINGQRDFTTVGDAVNVAFRLEDMTSQAEGRDLIIGEAAVRFRPDIAEHFSKITSSLKGKSQPVCSYCCSFQQLEHYLSLPATG